MNKYWDFVLVCCVEKSLMMLVTLLLYILIMAFSVGTLNYKHQLIETDESDYVQEIADFTRSEREKRAASLVLKGIAALRTLLSGAKQVRSQSLNFNNFVKPGDFDTAIDDFFEVVDPKNVKYTRRGFGSKGAYTQTWTADVGDRTFRLKTTSIKRNTVIEVIDKNAKSRARFGKINPSERKDYKIMYTKDST